MDKGSHGSSKTGPMDRRKFLVLASSAAAAGASALVAPCAGAQSTAYPDRPIRIIVPYTPGAAPDVVARIFASELPAYLGQNVIVENKPGAGGAIGVASVARATNDGYTLGLVAAAPMFVNPLLYRNLTYDPIKDFTPVIRLVSLSNLLLVSAQSPAISVQDLMRRMKQREKQNALLYNSVGNGSTQHLLGSWLAELAGASAVHVPFHGIADQLSALVTGQVDFGFVTLPSSISFVKGGRLRALAITSTNSAALLPDVPSLSSAGIEGFDKTDPWFGVAGPKELPEAVTQMLHRAFVSALDNPAIRAKLKSAGYDLIPPASTSELAQFMRDQVALWARLVKISGASND